MIKTIVSKIVCIALFICVFFSMGNIMLPYAAAKPEKAKKAYRDFMQSEKFYEQYYTTWERSGKFGLVDLNSDNVPELVTTSDDMYHYNIYSYVNNKVVFAISGFAGGASDAFYPGSGVIYQHTCHTGTDEYWYYKFNGEKMVEIAKKEGSDSMNLKTGKPKTTDAEYQTFKPYVYTIKGKSVSGTEYKAYVKKLKKGPKKKVKLANLVVPATNANYEKYL